MNTYEKTGEGVSPSGLATIPLVFCYTLRFSVYEGPNEPLRP